MKTKEEIATKHGIINGFTIHSIPSLAQRNLFEAMQEYSDQQTANLKAINEKQAELIARYEYANENKILFTRKYLQDIRNEISALQAGDNLTPTAVEMVREAFEPIQPCGKDRRKQLDELYETYIEELENHTTPHKGMKAMIESVKAEIRQEEPKHPTSWRDFTMTDDEPKCEECPSKQFYEANTAKIMDNIEQPKQTTDISEEKLFILDLLRLNNSEVMYSEETVINIIKQVKKYQNQQPEISVTDEDIQNAANDYWKDDVKEKPDLLPFAPSLFAAYNAGATDMRDNKIYISPK